MSSGVPGGYSHAVDTEQSPGLRTGTLETTPVETTVAGTTAAGTTRFVSRVFLWMGAGLVVSAGSRTPTGVVEYPAPMPSCP